MKKYNELNLLGFTELKGLMKKMEKEGEKCLRAINRVCGKTGIPRRTLHVMTMTACQVLDLDYYRGLLQIEAMLNEVASEKI